ncbi:MAG: hypothetical protein AAF587_18605 [Bacteroidota bacterium]
MDASTDSLETLAQKGWDVLNAEQFDEARVIGEQLIAQQHIDGYRILAEIYRLEEEPEDGIAILKQGVRAFDQNWELHLELGNMLSEVGKPQEAIEAYHTAKDLPNAEIHWLEINHAAARFKLGEIEEALTQLQEISEPTAMAEAFLMQMNILEVINRQDLILQIAEEDLEKIPAPEDDDGADTLSKICTKIASAAYHQEEEREKVMHYVQQALFLFRENEEALWLLRELQPEFSDTARMYVLLVSGEFVQDEGEEAEGFLSSYGIIAEDTNEAMEMIKSFEKLVEEVNPDSLKIVEVDEAENEDDDAKGLYFVSGFGVLENIEE